MVKAKSTPQPTFAPSAESKKPCPTIVGHERQRDALSRLCSNGKLPSTLMLCGATGIGKLLVARELARHILCKNSQGTTRSGCGECQACRLVDVGNHPDLHHLDFKSEETTPVADIRHVLEQLNLRSFLGGSKVAILNNADFLSPVGANILLKSLEEPRPDCYFLLIAANPVRLPVTLLSRCQRWSFERLSPAELGSVATASGITDLSDDMVMVADGSMELLGTLKAEPGFCQETADVVDRAFAGHLESTLGAALTWASAKETLHDRLTVLKMHVGRKLRDSAHNPDDAAVWAHTLQNVLDAEYLILERHVNPATCLATVLTQCDRGRSKEYRFTPNSQRPILEQFLS